MGERPSGAAAGRDGRRRISTPSRMVPGANFYFLTGASFHLMERPTLVFVPARGSAPRRDARSSSGRVGERRARGRDRSTGRTPTASTAPSPPWPAASRRPGSGSRASACASSRPRRCARAFPGATILDAHSAISRMRLHKDAAEIEAMRRAIAISEGALAATLAAAAAGMSETEFRGRLVAEMLAAGADGLAFDPIVLAGAASADPHGSPSPERRLERASRCWSTSAPPGAATWPTSPAPSSSAPSAPEHRDIYEAVRAANELGRTIAAPPMTLDTLDRRVTDSLRASGFGDLVAHQDRPRPRPRRPRGAAGDDRQPAGDGARHGLHHRARPLPRRRHRRAHRGRRAGDGGRRRVADRLRPQRSP